MSSSSQQPGLDRLNLGPRMAQAAARRLGFPVTFSHWSAPDRTGATRPVFAVPPEHRAALVASGLDAA